MCKKYVFYYYYTTRAKSLELRTQVQKLPIQTGMTSQETITCIVTRKDKGELKR